MSIKIYFYIASASDSISSFLSTLLSFSSAGTNAHPITKNAILNVEILIGSFGISSDVGPIITEYIEPIIRPIIQYIVCDLNVLSKYLTTLTVNKIPIITPNPNINTPGKYSKFNFNISFTPLSIGA